MQSLHREVLDRLDRRSLAQARLTCRGWDEKIRETITRLTLRPDNLVDGSPAPDWQRYPNLREVELFNWGEGSNSRCTRNAFGFASDGTPIDTFNAAPLSGVVLMRFSNISVGDLALVLYRLPALQTLHWACRCDGALYAGVIARGCPNLTSCLSYYMPDIDEQVAMELARLPNLRTLGFECSRELDSRHNKFVNPVNIGIGTLPLHQLTALRLLAVSRLPASWGSGRMHMQDTKPRYCMDIYLTKPVVAEIAMRAPQLKVLECMLTGDYDVDENEDDNVDGDWSDVPAFQAVTWAVFVFWFDWQLVHIARLVPSAEELYICLNHANDESDLEPDISGLASVSSLRSLQLSFSDVQRDVWPALASITQLKRFSLTGGWMDNPQVTGTSCVHWSALWGAALACTFGRHMLVFQTVLA